MKRKQTYIITIVEESKSKVYRKGLSKLEMQKEKKKLMEKGKAVYAWAE